MAPTPGQVAAAADANDFLRRWNGVHNFSLAPDLAPFDFEPPGVDRLLAELLRDPDSVVVNGGEDSFVHIPRRDLREHLLELPIEQALEQPLSLCHYALRRFDVPGGLLEGRRLGLREPCRRFLEDQGFALTDFFRPYVFISGPGCAAEYHMDFSHVLACQYFGRKDFYSFADPEAWAGPQVRREMLQHGHNAYTQPIPADAAEAEVVCCRMMPGDRLWNVLQTPHWVLAGDQISLSINISHRGVRHRGRLCPHEADLEHWKRELAKEAAAE